MKVKTRLFGEIEVADEKIIVLVGGLIGFPDMKKYTLIFDSDKEEKGNIMWLQSLDETDFAMPVMMPNVVVPEYNPVINDELLTPLGELTDENTYVLTTVRVPADDPKKATINLKAPIIINTDTCLGSQLIVDKDEDMRFPIYEALHKEGGR